MRDFQVIQVICLQTIVSDLGKEDCFWAEDSANVSHHKWAPMATLSFLIDSSS